MRSLALRALSLGTALTLGAAVLSAQAPAQRPQPRRGAQQQPQAAGDRVGRAAGLLFRDITLTDAQRTRVREVQQRYAEQRRELASEARAMAPKRARSDSAARGERQRPDSATRVATRAQREQLRARMQQLTDRQFADLRTVLEPSQQAAFDRNVSELKQRMAQRGQARGDRGVRGPKARFGGAAVRPGAALRRGA
ncbi:Spy/CpxP family protein refolding chaperone [Roseisolibacter agri]|nr:Spy/CpxP family protein refolding chaperone [Roseisolibacter agri]